MRNSWTYIQCAACLGEFWCDTNFRTTSRRDRCAIACCVALPPIVMGRNFSDDSGVTVPRSMRKAKSLHTLRYMHLAWGNAAAEEIKSLTGLHKLGVVGINEKNSRSLRSVISKLSLLESLSLSSPYQNSGILLVFLSSIKILPLVIAHGNFSRGISRKNLY